MYLSNVEIRGTMSVIANIIKKLRRRDDNAGK